MTARAAAQLRRRAFRIRPQHLLRVCDCVRRGTFSHPEPKGDRDIRCEVCRQIDPFKHNLAAPDHLAGTDQGRCALELLDCQKSKRVSHERRHARAARVSLSTETTKEDRESRQQKVGFGLSAACREPQQVHRLAFGGLGVRDRLKTQERETELKRPPHQFGRMWVDTPRIL